MTISARKITAFAKTVGGLADQPKLATTALLKAQFDSSPEELRVAVNGVVDDLMSVTPGSSGAEQIGSAPIVGVAGATPYAQMTDLKAQLNGSVIGQLPDGSVTDVKNAPTSTSSVKYAASTGTANTYSVSLNPAPNDYFDGMPVAVKINVDASAASTLNVNGLGAKPLKKANGNDITNLKANGVYTFRYNSTTGNFILQGEGGEYGTATAPQVLAPNTIVTDAGLVPGTMPDKTGVVKNLRTLNDATLGKAAGVESFTWTTPADQSILTVIPEAGYYDGVTSKIALGLWGIKPEFVKFGIHYGWTDGTNPIGVLRVIEPGNGLLINAGGGTLPNVISAYLKAKSISIVSSGTYRVSFGLQSSDSGNSVYGRLYKNGVAIGIERINNAISPPTIYTEDLNLVAGDSIELWVRRPIDGNDSFFTDFSLKINMPVVTL